MKVIDFLNLPDQLDRQTIIEFVEMIEALKDTSSIENFELARTLSLFLANNFLKSSINFENIVRELRGVKNVCYKKEI